MEEKEIKYQGKKIFYRARGEGLPVVLVHGFGEDGTVWEAQWKGLKDFHLIIPDLPGSGRSEMIDDMSLEGMAAMLERLIVHEAATIFYKTGQPGSVVMIGHSMGGYISLAFAEKHPEMLRGFGLFHSTAYADTEEKKQNRRKGIEFMQQHGAEAFLKTLIPNLYAPITKQQQPEKIERHLSQARNFSAQALVSYYKAMMERPDRRNILQNSAVPVMFIAGRHDTTVLLQDVLQQAHLPASSYIHILENAGHMGMVEEASAASEHLLRFLEFVKTAA